MKYTFHIFLFIISTALLGASSCKGKKKEIPKPPTTQSNPVKEGDLNTITLTDKAVERLGIKTFEVADKFVGNSRAFSGEVVATPGKTVTVTAPVAGTLMPSQNRVQIAVGQQVVKGQQIGRLVILPAEKDLLSVQADLTQWMYQVNNQVTCSGD